ncbi:hypothetical protein F5B21DRAFT_501888 [Xylaria acuta]|nr:hypothetical protein F5B21DRAFT_501888 [Xylaria acuta]
MASPVKTAPPTALDRGDRFGAGDSTLAAPGLPMPGLSGRANSPTGNLLKGPVDDDGKLKNAALMVGIKLDLEAEVHLTARVRGDVLHHVPASHGGHDALITGLFFLGGSNDDKENEFRYGNIRVHLQTSSQGFLFGVGRGSVSILRITLRFTIDFQDEEDFGLGMKNEGTETKRDGNEAHGKRDENDNAGAGRQGKGGWPGDLDGQHSLSLSLTMTITIMAVNSATLS